jgi:hypothetical protein
VRHVGGELIGDQDRGEARKNHAADEPAGMLERRIVEIAAEASSCGALRLLMQRREPRRRERSKRGIQGGEHRTDYRANERPDESFEHVGSWNTQMPLLA